LRCRLDRFSRKEISEPMLIRIAAAYEQATHHRHRQPISPNCRVNPSLLLMPNFRHFAAVSYVER